MSKKFNVKLYFIIYMSINLPNLRMKVNFMIMEKLKNLKMIEYNIIIIII